MLTVPKTVRLAALKRGVTVKISGLKPGTTVKAEPKRGAAILASTAVKGNNAGTASLLLRPRGKRAKALRKKVKLTLAIEAVGRNGATQRTAYSIMIR